LPELHAPASRLLREKLGEKLPGENGSAVLTAGAAKTLDYPVGANSNPERISSKEGRQRFMRTHPSTRRTVERTGAGTLAVGPIALARRLTQAAQVVEVTFRALDRDGNAHAPITLRWTPADQTEDRFWIFYSGLLDFVPRYQYRVRAFSRNGFGGGIEWEDSTWRDGWGSGALYITVPKREPTQVVHRDPQPERAAPRSPAPLPPLVVGLDDPMIRTVLS
jgi:hypothetical protein